MRFSDHKYFSLIPILFMSLIILIVLQVFADELESIFNFRLSGSERFMVVIILFLGAVTFPDTHLTSDIPAAGTNRAVDYKGPIASSIQNDNACYYDWK
jgi:hypothetical protein